MTASTFSYAQAAKSKPIQSPPSTPTAPAKPTAPDQVDEASAQTSQNDQSIANDTEGGLLASRSETDTLLLPSHDESTTLAANGVLPQTQAPVNPDSQPNDSIAPEIDQVSTHASTSESSSDKSPSTATTTNDPSTSSEHHAENDEPMESMEPVVVPLKVLKDAPAPVVNVWQQRAIDAKAKQFSIPAPMKPVKSSPNASSQQNQARRQSVGGRGGIGSRNTHNPQEGSRHFKGSASAGGRAPPTVQDEMSWPTPETAQVQSHEKATKNEKDQRPASFVTAGKSHGKHEWVAVPYTPSVKFHTPLPVTGRRGGRGGARGGRDLAGPRRESITEKGGDAEGSASTSTEFRGRRGSMATNAAFQQTRNRRPASANEAGAREQVEAENTKGFKRPSLPASSVDVNLNTNIASQKTATSSSRQAHAQHVNRSQQEEAIISQTPSDLSSGPDSNRPMPSSDQAGLSVNAMPTAGPSTLARSFKPNEGGVPDTMSARHRTSFNEGLMASPRNPENQRESWTAPQSRIDGRGRGRGRLNGHFTSHQSFNHATTTGHIAPINTSSPQVSRSPSLQSPYGQNGNHHGSSNRNYRGGPRSASIPNDSQRFNAGFQTPSFANFPPYPTSAGQMYDYNAMMPSSPVPYVNYYDSLLVINVAQQMQYYFSIENLIKDIYLRKHMDSQGYVSLNFIANFARMKALTTDIEVIKYACAQNLDLELRILQNGEAYLRRRDCWNQFVLALEERDASAQNEGPPTNSDQGQMRSSSYQHYPANGLAALMPNFIPLPTPTSYAANGHGFSSGNSASNRHPMSLVEVPSPQPQAQADVPTWPNAPEKTVARSDTPQTPAEFRSEEKDSYPDENLKDLTVLVRPLDPAPPSKSPYHMMGSRTFSNGSIDGAALLGESQQPAAAATLASASTSAPDERQPRQLSRPNGLTDREHSQQMLNPNTASPSDSRSPSGSSTAHTLGGMGLFWMKGKEKYSTVPSDYDVEPYLDLRDKAFHQRQLSTSTTCTHDLNLLYGFWSHFLIRNFNMSMYEEFRQSATEDASIDASQVGMTHLLKYYSEALASQHYLRDVVARHYVDLVKQELQTSDKRRPAFEQLRSAWRNGALNMKNRKKILDLVDAEVRVELDR